MSSEQSHFHLMLIRRVIETLMQRDEMRCDPVTSRVAHSLCATLRDEEERMKMACNREFEERIKAMGGTQ